MIDYIIPKPKTVKVQSGKFAPASDISIYYADNLKKIAEFIREILPFPAEIKRHSLKGHGIVIGREPKYITSSVPEGEQAYSLDVNNNTIQIRANSYRGVYYGYATLKQVLDRAKYIPQFSITDWPDLDMRGIQFDLKGAVPTPEYIKQSIITFAEYKINTVLMEYENMFPYDGFPEFVSPIAFTKEQLKDILDTAKDHAVEVIPLVQTLGHAEYVLRHEKYAHLAESGTRRMYCPLNHDAFEFVKGLIDQVLPWHDSKYFHIGADEAWSLGSCPLCSKYSQKNGRGRLLVDYVKKIGEYLGTKGKRIIIWDDMFPREKCFHLLKELPENTSINLWEYDCFTGDTAYVRWGGKTMSAKEWVEKDPKRIAEFGHFGEWLENLTEEEIELFKEYKYGDNYPWFGHPIPWMRKYQEEGLEVIGASCVKGSGIHGVNSLFPYFRARHNNTSVWAKKAKEAGIKGVISTSWSRYNTPTPPSDSFESAVYSTIEANENYWNTDNEQEEFDIRFSENFFGTASNVTRAMGYLERGRDSRDRNLLWAAEVMLRHEGKNIRRNKQFVELLANAAAYEGIRADVEIFLYHVQPFIYYKFETDALRNEVRISTTLKCQKYIDKIKKWEEEAVELYLQFMPKCQTLEFVNTKTIAMLRNLEMTIKEI